MASTFQNFNVFFRTLVLLGLVLLGGWWTLFLRSKLATNEQALTLRTEELAAARADLETREAEIRDLGAQLAARTAEAEQLRVELAEAEERAEALALANRLLKVQHRLARMEVLAMEPRADDPDRMRTRVRFTELDTDGQPLAPGVEVAVEGSTIYVESLVIQFEDSYVEQGDALRGTSLCLFRRLFGEDQKPSDGVPLDASGQRPLVYGGDTTPGEVHRALWARFWDYANDPALARELGVRALQGEAPFIEARPGKAYRLELRASGGLVIEAE